MVLGWLILFQAVAYAGGAPATRTRPAPNPPECDATICSAALSPDDRDALGRLAYAEAGDQGEEGLAAVLYTVLNRLASGRFGSDVSAVIEAAGQFEPVNHVGGHWRSLVPLHPGQRATIETMLDLIQQGRLPDPTHGATFFQNPRIVADREGARQVHADQEASTESADLTNFNHQTPLAVIRDHAFFGQLGKNDPPAANVAPQVQIVYLPSVAPRFRIERIDAATPAYPHMVMYRIVPLVGVKPAG